MTPSRSSRARAAADRAAAPVADRDRDLRLPRAAGRPRTGAKKTLLHTIRQLPHYLRLLGGLLVDRRVAAVDKALVAGAIAYILLPLDLIPDVIPFLGEVDDVFLLVTALQRLVTNAGRRVLLDHWHGDAKDLADLNLAQVVSAAAFFLPLGMRRRLRGLLRR
ncbi:YkvA family protein [Roseisolibacter sp. H3M3-2]|uniref:YkvA family protein n=1 Tax=Roseisolibacter sp. H3M3-2 TaxID=3031323 RepID=UPI0023D9AAD6|nr:YkvA family protein [Roseisolibacter sp. H3M3-2]MDF1503368.1 YkvA family protein [Roseisolibacter sp. H3M3-2]